MDDQERKRLQRERKNAKAREKYKRLRELGYTPEEARSVKKALVRKKPTVVEKTAEVIPEVAKLVEQLGTTVFKKPPRPKKKTREERNRDEAFKRLVRKHPELTPRSLAKLFRDKGRTISNEKATTLTRKVRGLAKQEKKVTRVKYLTFDEAPDNRFYLKDRYAYVMKFDVYRDDHPEPLEDYLTIMSGRKLNKKERKQRTLEAYDLGHLHRDNRYMGRYIDEDTIQLVYAVDMHKRSRRFERFASQHPGVSEATLIRLYREKMKKG